MHEWLAAQRQRVPEGSATAKALDYSLNRWAALTRYLDDPRLPIDNNRAENAIRPFVLGRMKLPLAEELHARGRDVRFLVDAMRAREASGGRDFKSGHYPAHSAPRPGGGGREMKSIFKTVSSTQTLSFSIPLLAFGISR